MNIRYSNLHTDEGPLGGVTNSQLSLAAGFVIVAALVLYFLFETPAELRPLRAAKLTALPEFGGEYKDRMLWGSYRPGLYFGMRTR
jgi:mannosyl-oligosaccharide glucosidase